MLTVAIYRCFYLHANVCGVKGKGNVVPANAMNSYGEMKAQLHSFLISALGGNYYFLLLLLLFGCVGPCRPCCTATKLIYCSWPSLSLSSSGFRQLCPLIRSNIQLTSPFCPWRGSVIARGTAVEAGRSRVLFPMRSSRFLIYLILRALLWSWGRLSLDRKCLPGIYLGIKADGA